MQQIQAPHPFTQVTNTTVFLAGSIEMGAAVDWQKQVVRDLSTFDCTLFNPRRLDWDSSWKQSMDSPYFCQQVNWELDALDASNIIVFYFDPNTKSPISLLELGRHAKDSDKKIIVFCPEGFWRKGNVDIVCTRSRIKVHTTYESFIKAIQVQLMYA